MIAVKIGDGMGNQLFNYACGYAQARREKDSLLLITLRNSISYTTST